MFAPAPPGDPDLALLAEAAFGIDPGRAVAELPPASDALGSWYRAVVLGGQGRYAAARVELRKVCNHSTDPVLLSLAGSTAGSLLRQLGWHARAAAFDGRAAALILATDAAATETTRKRSDDDGPDRHDALCDALTGLAADALGVGRLALADRLLRRSRAATAPGEMGWRSALRWHWVCAETALIAGNSGPATGHADAAMELAERAPSVRHRVKSRLLLAAAAAAGVSTTGPCRLPKKSPSSVASTGCYRCGGQALCCAPGWGSRALRRRRPSAPRPSLAGAGYSVPWVVGR